jgi:hypothetical protein
MDTIFNILNGSLITILPKDENDYLKALNDIKISSIKEYQINNLINFIITNINENDAMNYVAKVLDTEVELKYLGLTSEQIEESFKNTVELDTNNLQFVYSKNVGIFMSDKRIKKYIDILKIKIEKL